MAEVSSCSLTVVGNVMVEAAAQAVSAGPEPRCAYVARHSYGAELMWRGTYHAVLGSLCDENIRLQVCTHMHII